MERESFDVVVIGNAGVDTNVYLYGDDVDCSVEANFTENLDYVGQAGGYASRGYARLGHRTAFIGTVGDDFQGRLVSEELARDGIDLTGLFFDPQGTARSVNFMSRDGRRKNFYDGKGHMIYMPDLDLCGSILAGARLAHFNIPNWARYLLPLARAAGATVAVDLQDIISVDDPYRRDFVEQADILFFSSANHVNPEPLIAQLLAGRPDRVVLSGMGAAGCTLGTTEDIRNFPPVTLPWPVVDTNGAGDALAVGFLSSYLFQGYALEEAVRRGQTAARATRARSAPLHPHSLPWRSWTPSPRDHADSPDSQQPRPPWYTPTTPASWLGGSHGRNRCCRRPMGGRGKRAHRRLPCPKRPHGDPLPGRRQCWAHGRQRTRHLPSAPDSLGHFQPCHGLHHRRGDRRPPACAAR